MKEPTQLPVLQELKKQLVQYEDQAKYFTTEALKIRSAIEILTGTKSVNRSGRTIYAGTLPSRIFNILHDNPGLSAPEIRDMLLQEKKVSKDKRRDFDKRVWAALARLVSDSKLKGNTSGYTIVGKTDKGY